ncbi:MAG: helix-turn-helix transcriptional regulator [Lachnospiraceae bacterium]|nr:helix-turn-helix transcriptional regulator [Lachnospiraceae bacterium]
MLNENLKTIRKKKGFSQEQLALRLNVVRQTVSKWEQGLSVPDAEMLVKISEVLNVPVSDLLGKGIAAEPDVSSLDTIALELEKLNELLVTQQMQRAKIMRLAAGAVAVIFLVLFAAAIYDRWNEMFYEFGRNLYRWFH